jgi:hypothetical protein
VWRAGGGRETHAYAGELPKAMETVAYGCGRRWSKRLGFDLREAAPNRYDGWDQRVREASDEPTVQKYERRSNH